MCKASERHWFSVLKKNDMITGQTWIWRRQRTNQIRKHFNHAVEVRKICYQVVQRKQLEEISSKVDRFQSLVLHSLYAWVVPGTTDDCALLQRQGQERHHSLSAWLPLSQSWRFRRHFPCPDELATWEESLQPKASSSSGSPSSLGGICCSCGLYTREALERDNQMCPSVASHSTISLSPTGTFENLWWAGANFLQ